MTLRSLLRLEGTRAAGANWQIMQSIVTMTMPVALESEPSSIVSGSESLGLQVGASCSIASLTHHGDDDVNSNVSVIRLQGCYDGATVPLASGVAAAAASVSDAAVAGVARDLE